MNLTDYHEKIWIPFSNKVYSKFEKYRFLKVLMNLYNIHFTILSLIGISKTPEDELDCYYWIFKRDRKWKYEDITLTNRIKLIFALIRKAFNCTI
jgi:hypothetical protein